MNQLGLAVGPALGQHVLDVQARGLEADAEAGGDFEEDRDFGAERRGPVVLGGGPSTAKPKPPPVFDDEREEELDGEALDAALDEALAEEFGDEFDVDDEDGNGEGQQKS